MLKIIPGLLESIVVVASMATAATAEHHIRHKRMTTSEGNAWRLSSREAMGKTVLKLLGSGLIVASTASAVMAAPQHIRHHHPYASESAQHGLGRYHPTAVSPGDPNAFGTITPSEWTTGMQADDWRQSVNGR